MSFYLTKVKCGINPVADPDLKVQILIDFTGSWNEDLVKSLVSPYEANQYFKLRYTEGDGRILDIGRKMIKVIIQ